MHILNKSKRHDQKPWHTKPKNIHNKLVRRAKQLVVHQSRRWASLRQLILQSFIRFAPKGTRSVSTWLQLFNLG